MKGTYVVHTTLKLSNSVMTSINNNWHSLQRMHKQKISKKRCKSRLNLGDAYKMRTTKSKY